MVDPSVKQLLITLNRLGVKLSVDGDSLRSKAPKGALTPALRAQVAAHKSEIIAWLRQAQHGQKQPPLRPTVRDRYMPLSYSQERLWFLDQLEGSSATYNMPGAARLTGNLDLEALKQSLWELVRRHESLRTTFTTVGNQPMQVIGKPYLNLSVIDLTHHEHAMQETEVKRVGEAEAKRPFDLTKGPLLRVTLLRLDKKNHMMLVTLHHIVSDGWSIYVFIREMAALYTAFVKGESSPLPELPIQYADYAYWQRNWLKGEVMKRLLDFWREQLAGAPLCLELPTDRLRPPVQSFRGSRYYFSLPKALSEQLQQFSVESGVTLFMTLLSAFKVLMMRYSGQEDIVIGTPIANRRRVELESLIGFFLNLLVLRTDLSGNPRFSDFLKQVQKVTLDAYHHQDVPFEKLVEELQPERNLSYSPIFQVMFHLRNMPRTTTQLSDLTIASLEFENDTAKYDLVLSIQEEAQGLMGDWEYNTDIFDAATIERMAAQFEMLLEAIVEDADQNISALSMMTADEIAQLIEGFNTDLEI